MCPLHLTLFDAPAPWVEMGATLTKKTCGKPRSVICLKHALSPGTRYKLFSCVCMFPFAAKVNILEVFCSPLIRSKTWVYVNVDGDRYKYVGLWWSFFPAYHSFPPYGNSCTRKLLCLWSPLAIFALKRKTGEHTFGGTGTERAGRFTVQGIPRTG